MYTALHLKYRPRTLNELTGQEYVQKTLINALQGNKIAPAYLFTGPRGTGKTSTARMFAKSLNCITSSKPTVHPCGKCQSCRSIDKSTSLDVAEIDAASNNGVDDARSLIERSSFAPAVGRYRIFILDECLAGDSLVLTDSGLVRIDNPAIIGKNVLSYNEANERWEFKPITRQWIKGNRHTLVIKTAVTEIRCTPEHLIRTNHGWKKAETIQPGDRILIAPTTFLPKSGSKSLNHCDPFVPVAVENAWTFQFSTNAAPSIMSSTPTGSNTRLNKITELSNQLQIKSLCSNLYDLSAPVDAAESLRFQPISSITELLSREFSITGQNIPTTIGMVASLQQSEIAMMPKNPSRPKLWDEFTELCSVMDRSATHMPIPFLPECPGHTALTRRIGYDINASSSQSLFPRLRLHQTRVMGRPRFVLEPSATPISEKSIPWCDQIVIASESLQTGSTALVKRGWHGGTWMMDRSTTLPLVRPQLPCTQKGIQKQRISFCSNGLNPLDIQLLSGVSRKLGKSTTLLDSQQSVVENGSNSSVSMLFQQWHTNSTCVKSVAWSGIAEPVYDLEVADNHNFVANGLLVHNCHQLTAQSQNALLKCIEEPPAHVIFIFCTTEPHKVLPTITSRCQVFNFRALSITAIVEQLRFVAQLESIAITDEALVALARTADGGLRDALQLLDQLSLLGVEITKNHVFELSGNVVESDLVAILQAIEKGNIFGLLQLSRSLLDSGKTPKLILSNLLTIYRDLLIVMASPKSQDLITGAIAYSQLKQLATPWDYEAVSTGLIQLQKSENQLRNAAQPHLWLEVCLLGLVTTRSEHSHNSNNSNGSMTALNPLGKSQPKAPRSNLSAIWNKVLESATPNNRSLLTHAELVELKNGFAVITVEAKYFDKFNSNTKKVERIFQKATGARVTVSIKENE